MKKKKTAPNPFRETEKVISGTECTGLMPALPQDDEQDEHYASLYAVHDAGDADEK